ncbi:TPA: Rrf2 family transcriptional regulator [Vibrio harveyi]|nr:Rrf2 family transcriptional regulator [Vibrio harveyi]
MKGTKLTKTVFSPKLNIALSITSEIAGKQSLMNVESISSSLSISMSYTEQIVAALRKGGIIKSQRGPGGGYTLKNEDITVLDVFKAINADAFQCESNKSIYTLLEGLFANLKVLDLNSEKQVTASLAMS